MGFLERIRVNVQDVHLFGPAVVTRHLGRLRKNRIAQLQIDGTVIHVRAGESDIAAVRQVFGQREYDISGFACWKRVLRRYEDIISQGGRPVIVDAGANIGTATIWFKHRFPEAAIVAIEPDPGTVEILRLNAAGLEHVYVMPAAIGSEPGCVELVSEGLSWAVQTERATKGIPVITMSDALSQVPGGVPLIAKIDIEGFERDLFAANTDWIDDMAAVILEPHDWMLPGQYTSVPFQQAMGTRRFELLHRGENIFYIR